MQHPGPVASGRIESVFRRWMWVCAALAWGGEPSARLLWDAPGANVLGAPFPDGAWISCVDPATGDLALLDTASAKLRRLTQKPATAAKEFAYFSVPSRDGRQVAYAWFNDEGFYDLRVVQAKAGATPRVLFRNAEAGFVQPASWTPDGSYILTLFFRKDNISQIALVNASDGSARVLKSLNWVYPKKMDISPDGRWIAYDSFGGDRPGPRDIFLLALDGSRAATVVDGPAEDVFPVWSPDGREILFASDRAGSMDAWAVRVEHGQAAGEPRLVKKGLDQFLPMGVTRAGALFFGVRTGATEVAVMSGDGVPQVLATRTPGRNQSPAWSRDGRQLAYLSRRGAENFGLAARVIVLRDLETGLERDLPARLAHIEWLRWSPDGEWLLAAGSDGKGRSGLFRVRVRDSLVKPERLVETADYHGVPGDWKPDGSVLVDAAARALAISPQGTVARAGQERVEAGDRSWPLANTTWLEWAGDRLLAAGGGKAFELTPVGWRELRWKEYDGGPFSAQPDGRRIALSLGRTRQQVWIMDHAFEVLDRGR